MCILSEGNINEQNENAFINSPLFKYIIQQTTVISQGGAKMSQKNNFWLEQTADILWGPATIGLIMIVGLIFTVNTGAFQIRHGKKWLGATIGSVLKKGDSLRVKDKKSISQFQSLTVALAGTLGTGNIVGVATAITIGGAGSIFWMVISAVLSMIICYAENVLGILYRRRNTKGEWCGGPMQYMEYGMGCKWLAVIFALACTLAALGMGNMVQINALAQSAQDSLSIPPLVTGIIVASVVGAVLLGGIKRAAMLTEKLIPIISIAYLAVCLIVITVNAKNIPQAFSDIIKGAFAPESAAGGVLGTLLIGIRRGIASNEAGLGGSVMVHSCADVEHPVIQGMWGIFEVFADTVVFCTLTALAILTSGALGSGLDGALLSAAAFESVLGSFGGVFLTVSIALFAFSTMIGWSCYGEKSFTYIFGEKYTVLYRVIFIMAIVLGSVMQLSAVWSVSDILNAVMAFPNLAALIILAPKVKTATKDYLSK